VGREMTVENALGIVQGLLTCRVIHFVPRSGMENLGFEVGFSVLERYRSSHKATTSLFAGGFRRLLFRSRLFRLSLRLFFRLLFRFRLLVNSNNSVKGLRRLDDVGVFRYQSAGIELIVFSLNVESEFRKPL